MTCAVYMLVPPTVMLLDMVGPLEVLRVAAQFGADVQIHVVAPSTQVSTSLPFQLAQLEPLPVRLQAGDLVMVPGVVDEATAYRSAASAQLVAFLRHAVDAAQHDVMSICSGAFLLGQAGLLDGRVCTTHHQLTAALQRECPQALVRENRVFVEDGRVFSSAGICAGLDVTLHWLALRYGAQIALDTARHMNIYFRRSPNDSALSPWLVGRNHIHPAIHRVQNAIAAHPAASHTLSELAAIAFVGSRHLTRLFKQHTGLTVHDYQRTLKHALFDQWRSAGYSQEAAALAAGFSSANAWRKSKYKNSPKNI
ncbi:MAG: GlxA family transcriptional regulator [Formosimonas sp.]